MKTIILLSSLLLSGFASAAHQDYSCGDVFWGFAIRVTDNRLAGGHFQMGYSSLRFQDCDIKEKSVTCKALFSHAVGEEHKLFTIRIEKKNGVVSGIWKETDTRTDVTRLVSNFPTCTENQE